MGDSKNIKEDIQKNLTAAMKEKRETEVLVLRQLLAAFLNKEKEKIFRGNKENPDISPEDLAKESQLKPEEEIEVVALEAKKRRESIVEFEKGKRNDLVEKEKKELEILQKYLPEQMSEEEIERIVKEAIGKVGAKEIKDMGKVMAELMPKTKGKADGSLVSKIVKESLS